MKRPSDLKWLFAHLAALAAASGCASLILFYPAWAIFHIIWPIACLYSLIIAMPAYALAVKLRHTGWIAAAAWGCAASAPLFLLFAGSGAGLWSLQLAGAGGIAGLTFRAVIIALIGKDWLSPPAPS